MPNVLQNVALIGATGNIGSRVLAALLDQGRHALTAITRSTSKSTFPAGVTVYRGNLEDPSFLQSSLAGKDVLVSLVAHDALRCETLFLEAAERVGVKVFIPSDYGNPLSDQRFVRALPTMKQKMKLAVRARETDVVLVNVVTGFWIDLVRLGPVFRPPLPAPLIKTAR